MTSPVQLKAAPKATTWSVDDIVEYAAAGRLLIPDFQRSFKWKAPDVLKLFDSIRRGYPVGNLLVWETSTPENARPSFSSAQIDESESAALVIIDGQQRITSLVEPLLGGGRKDINFNIYFDLKREEFITIRPKEKIENWLLPMTEVSDTFRFLEWLQNAKLSIDLVRNANLMVKSLRDYKVPVYTVRGGKELKPIIRDIFNRMNSTGKELTDLEVFNASYGENNEKGGFGLAQVADRLADLKFGKQNQDWLLKGLAATLNHASPKEVKKVFAIKTEEGKRDTLDNLEIALREEIKFLKTYAKIPHWSLLPYRFSIIPLTAFFSRFKNPSPVALECLKAWLWNGARSGTHAFNGITAIRESLAAIYDTKNAEQAAATLGSVLDTTSRVPPFELGIHNSRNAATKVVCCALASLRPRHLDTEEEVDLSKVLEDTNPFPQIVVRPKAGTETRLLHPAFASGAKANPRQLVEHITEPSLGIDVLKSHAIGGAALSCLADGDEDGFIEARKADLQAVVDQFLATMCK
ncbi:MAG: DUF262 domain-containing protein [Deltaproteobacteria bacterium]|nr:DUF262 domain-containing protein [Deltaproteobacteria bacterium]